MRKFILSVLVVILSVSAGSSIVSAQTKDEKGPRKVAVFADSARSKGKVVGKRVAEGTVMVVDSVGSKGKRLGKKAKIVGDTVAKRSTRAFKAMKGQ